MGAFKVVFYEKEDGSKPAEEYLHSISPKMVAKIYSTIGMLKERGNQVQDGIFQIRAQQEGNISRVLYFFTIGQTIVLTHGFTKKTPKTPPAEIELAKKYRADYERREAQQK